ncbi:hypothetical protein CDAR_468731 [Caerostris darwini]|uniref:Uncharacterized protein n=1 Tax=Caerostris darwini TaxID=1538125 RepID=A0AAV4T9I8_9ARAC|nr:hypothetical protein CDAR_468731 [Caerostris darwini]
MKFRSPIIAHESAPARQCSHGIETTAPFDSAGWLMDSVLMAPQAIRLCSVRAMGYSSRTLFISQKLNNRLRGNAYNAASVYKGLGCEFFLPLLLLISNVTKRKTPDCSIETMKFGSPIIAHGSAPASQCCHDIETTAPFDSAGWLMDSVLMAPQAIRLCSVRAMGYSSRTLFISQNSPSPIIAHESAPASHCSRGIGTTAPFDSAGWVMDSVLMAPQAIRLCSVRAMSYSGRTLFISQE